VKNPPLTFRKNQGIIKPSINAMTGTSNALEVSSESRRLVRGAQEPLHEYIPKLRTERLSPVGCDGRTRYRARVCMYPLRQIFCE